MALRSDRLAEEAVTQGARTGVSFLAGIRGFGTLQVVRDRGENAAEILGTWRAEDENADLTSLERAVQAGEAVRFEGALDDPLAPDRQEIVARCVVSSFGDYDYGATLPEGETGPTHRVYNFRPVDPDAVVGRP